MKSRCLSIAGFDGSGGAGIQADLKTFSALGCYGMTVLTALPVQNTCGVRSVYDIPVQAIKDQLQAIFEDIVPDAIKVGMLFSSAIVELVANFLRPYEGKIPIVLDPVMAAKSGDTLLQSDAILALKEQMIPLASVITPNLPEAYILVGESMAMVPLAEQLLALGSEAVLLKGGHGDAEFSDDYFLDQSGTRAWLRAKRVLSKNTHGTGCTLSAAICALLAQKYALLESCRYAKGYLSAAILAAQALSVGRGAGPVHHFYHLWPTLDKLTRSGVDHQ